MHMNILCLQEKWPLLSRDRPIIHPTIWHVNVQRYGRAKHCRGPIKKRMIYKNYTTRLVFVLMRRIVLKAVCRADPREKMMHGFAEQIGEGIRDIFRRDKINTQAVLDVQSESQ